MERKRKEKRKTEKQEMESKEGRWIYVAPRFVATTILKPVKPLISVTPNGTDMQVTLSIDILFILFINKHSTNPKLKVITLQFCPYAGMSVRDNCPPSIDLNDERYEYNITWDFYSYHNHDNWLVSYGTNLKKLQLSSS